MKKIIATVLAMVMALALCTTAFAADPVAGYTGYTRGGEKLMANATDAESFICGSSRGCVRHKPPALVMLLTTL